MDDQVAGLGKVGIIVFPLHPDWFWCLPNLLGNAYQKLSPMELSRQNVKLTDHLHPNPRSRMYGDLPPRPLYTTTAW